MNFLGGFPITGGGGVTCGLQCPFSNVAKLFRSNVVCENLVQIG